jgi:hypothetical protein
MPLVKLRAISGLVLLVAAFPGAALAGGDWEPSVYPEHQLFPSFLISTATAGVPENEDQVWDCPEIGDANGVIGAMIYGVKKGQKIRVTVKANDLMGESTFEGVAPKTAKRLLVHPKVKYRYGSLAKVHQQEPLDVTLETWIDGESTGEQTITTDLHSINDCLFAVADEKGNVEFDANWNFAAYVNENHPWVDDILREALDTGVVDSFDGYQSGKSHRVLLQIYAIWNVMQRRGIRYSSITTTASESKTVLSQHVRLFDESVRARQANCVDGSVMLAAVLRKIGLRTFLVLLPGHMFLAVDLKEDNDKSMIGVETTMMGDDNLASFNALKKIPASKREELKNQTSFSTFEAAVDIGTKNLEDHADDFKGDDSDYQLVDIAAARSEGIMPIGYSSDR